MTETPSSTRSRRALLAALGAGAVGTLAGCGGDGDDGDGGDGAGGTTTPTDAPATSTPVPSTTAAPSSTVTTAVTTVPPTTTRATTTVPTTRAPTMTSAGDWPTTTLPGPDAADIVVSPDEDTGGYSSVDEAFSAVPIDSSEETVVFLHEGTYYEDARLPDNRPNVTLVGADVQTTVISHAENARGSTGTTDTPTLEVLADGFSAYNVTIENTAPPVAQKVALLAEGDRQFYHNCRLLSHQDTLYVRDSGNRQYFLECYVEGTTDFVFGDAGAVLDRCELVCLEDASHVTAANTLPEYTGIVVKHSTVRGGEGAAESSVSLGRPWGPNARTAFVDCELGPVIAPSGWSDWGGRGETATYVECANRGEGFVPEERVDWATVLDPGRLGEFHLVFEEWDPLGKTD